MILEAIKIEKTIGDRLLFSVDQLRISRQDRIGLIGRNGTGKTTLVELLTGLQKPDKGEIATCASIETIPQLKKQETHQSGGEITQEYINKAFAKAPDILFADEPTTNLDVKRVEQLEQKLIRFKGAIVVISHDRKFLDRVCNKIWEVDHQTITVYKGNFSDYIAIKELKKRQQMVEYEKYQKKKKQLEQANELKKQKANTMIKPPSKRMGYSESKLWKVQKGTKQKVMHQSIEALETRIDKLVKVERPKQLPTVKMSLPSQLVMKNQTIIRVQNINTSIDGRTLWENASFRFRNGTKTAIIGPNGCGKTTLVKSIIQEIEGVRMGTGVKWGYFSQDLDTLDINLFSKM